MFPDYPKTKRHLQKKFATTIQKETGKDPFISMIHFREMHEGASFNLTTEDGFSEKGTYQEISAKFEISKDEMILKGPEAYFSRVEQVAKEIVENYSRIFAKKMDEVTEKTGNIVDGKSQPLSPELILDALDKMELSFDEFGNMMPPALVVSPKLAKKLQEQKVEPNPILEIRKKLIIDRKRQEWLDRESNRKLVS